MGAASASASTRMGVSPAASVARTRMGATPSEQPVSADDPAPVRNRMGRGATHVVSGPSEVSVAARTAPAATGAGPWKRRLIWVASLLAAATAVVFLARWLREVPAVADFIVRYPGTPTMSRATPEGVSGWIGWQHFFNMFFMVLIVRTGLQVRNEKKAPGYFTARKNSFFSPPGATPKKVSLSQWIHQALDVFWMLNGVIFVVLLIVTDQWLRIVPTHWDVIPNALSAGLQYASLEWPHENGWIHYNALQMLTYTMTVFIAAPLAIISGIRFSTWWPDTNTRLTKIYPIEIARAIHFPVMLYFVAFTVVHISLVMLTGALRNLNHMYTSRDTTDWIGLLVFLGSLLVIAAAWILTKPLFIRPVARRFGALSK